MRRTAIAFALALVIVPSVSGIARTPANQADPPQVRQDAPASAAARAHASIDRGLAFLRASQNKDGSWGSHDPVVIDQAQLGFGMLDFGCHDGMRAACTAICAKALLGYPRHSGPDEIALRKAIDYLLANFKLAFDPGNAFNVWGYIYHLDFMTTLYDHPFGKPYRKRIAKVIPRLVAGLEKMRVAEGGWAYYTSVMMEGASISFITASGLIPLMRARDLGFEVPEALVNDAGRIIKTQQLPNKNFIYGTYLKYTATHHLEDLSSGGRTQACGLAVHLFDGSFTRADLEERNSDYFKNIDYVEKIGNKRIIPHRDAPQNISGYFLYYGCYYAAEVLTLLGDKAREENWRHLLEMILRNQEGEGSWWDTMCYDYGDKWGTGFAILCLEHYLQAHDRLDSGPLDPDQGGPPADSGAGG